MAQVLAQFSSRCPSVVWVAMAVFCDSSKLATPFLKVDTSNTDIASWNVLEEGGANPEADVSEQTKTGEKLRSLADASYRGNLRLQMFLIGAIFFVSVATFWTLT